MALQILLLPLLLAAVQSYESEELQGDEEYPALLELKRQRQGSVQRPLLVIHAGLHKTGTTSLQLSMNTCSDWANSVGVTSLTLEGQPKKVNHNFLVHFAESLGWELPLYKETLDLRNESAYLRSWERLRECEELHFAGLRPCRALLSSELFTEAQVPVWQKLLEQLPKWNVRILVFHRYYPAWLLSLYGEYQRDYMVDTAHNPMSLLEFALEGPGAQLSPRRTLERIQEALSVCKGGDTAQCSVQGASYDLFQHQGYDQYEYLVLNVTLELRGHEFVAANKSLWEGCPQRTLTHASPPNLTLAVDLVRLLKNSHQARGCTSPFELSASNREVLEFANKEVLPVSCMDIGNLLADDSARWFESAHVEAPKYHKDSQFCQVKQQALTAQHWKAMHKLTPACHGEKGRSEEVEEVEPEQADPTPPVGFGPSASMKVPQETLVNAVNALSGGLRKSPQRWAQLTEVDQVDVDAGRSFFVESPPRPRAEGSLETSLSGGGGAGAGAGAGAARAADSERGFSVPVMSSSSLQGLQSNLQSNLQSSSPAAPSAPSAPSAPTSLFSASPSQGLFGEPSEPEDSTGDSPFSSSASALPSGLQGLEGLFGNSQLQLSSYVSGFDGFNKQDLSNVKKVQLPQARGLNQYEKSGTHHSSRSAKASLKASSSWAFAKASHDGSHTGKSHGASRAQSAHKAHAEGHAEHGSSAVHGKSKPWSSKRGAPKSAASSKKSKPSKSSASSASSASVFEAPPVEAEASGASMLDHLDGIPKQKPGLPGMAGVFSDEAARPVVRVDSKP